MSNKQTQLIGVIDVGTNSIAFAIYVTPQFTELAAHEMGIKTYTPQPGWSEQDPIEIIHAIRCCAKEACYKLTSLTNYKVTDIVGIGVTNHRETTIMWDKCSGKPFYNAILWNDSRTDEIAARLQKTESQQNIANFKKWTGLPLCGTYSLCKILWLKDNVPSLKRAFEKKYCTFGTLDSWIVWNLTGGVKDGVHVTDVTNASRTMLMNLDTLCWDVHILRNYSICPEILPEIKSSSEVFGIVKDSSVLCGIKISGILGNQQASMLGHNCYQAGQAKATIRSDCVVLCNTGKNKIISNRGLMTTVAFKLGKKQAIYALEGIVTTAGEILNWLKNDLELIREIKDAQTLAKIVPNTGDVYFVPALNGLSSPYYRKDARGILCGLTQFTTKHHIIRAALESICFRNLDILDMMSKELDMKFNNICVDGSYALNNLLMQLQADILGSPVLRAQLKDTTRLGIAMCAATSEGVNAIELNTDKQFDFNAYDKFMPSNTDKDRAFRYGKWKKAVDRSFGWIEAKKKHASCPCKSENVANACTCLDMKSNKTKIFSFSNSSK